MSIELTYPGEDTATRVKDLPDDWIIVGPIRACIHLSAVWHMLEPKAFAKDRINDKGAVSHRLNGIGVFGPIDLNHPWAQWAAANDKQYNWLYFYAMDMCDEYVKRFPHMTRHGMNRMLQALEYMPESVPEGEWTEPAFALNLEFTS